MKRALFFLLLLLLFPTTATAKTTIIETRGIAITTPGEFAKQFFYIIDGKNLWQIYSYRSNFPIIKIGDILLVRGEESETKGLRRLKIKEKSQIKILSNHALPNTPTIDNKKIKENIGKLVLLEGKLEKDENSLYFLTDQKEKILVISPKKATNFDTKLGFFWAKGVPLKINGQISFLVFSFEEKTSKEQKKEASTISKDLIRPEKEFYYLRISLFIFLFIVVAILLTKIFSKKKVF
ncbi:MAG: hypothetical protein ACOYMB_03670 [Patescibacteria group bacterium]